MSNVDSQASNNNILIQVIGEMSNKSAPHRKFVQTFILAEQPNGYFVLNDIFRYINDEEEGEAEFDGFQGPVSAQLDDYQDQQATDPEPKALTSSADPAAQQHDADVVIRQLEQKVLKEGSTYDPEPKALAAEAKTNGVGHHDTTKSNHAKGDSTSATSLTNNAAEPSAEAAESAVAQEIEEPEKPQDPVPTRVASPKPKTAAVVPQTAPAVPTKPAAPKTWAKLVATSATTAPSVPSSTTSTSPAPPQSKGAPAAEKPVQRNEASPTHPGQGTTSAWQTAGNEHTKRQTRPQSVAGSGEKENVLAYVRNVTDKVSTDGLKAALQNYGELAYFDVSRQKVRSLCPRPYTTPNAPVQVADLVRRTVHSSNLPPLQATPQPWQPIPTRSAVSRFTSRNAGLALAPTVDPTTTPRVAAAPAAASGAAVAETVTEGPATRDDRPMPRTGLEVEATGPDAAEVATSPLVAVAAPPPTKACLSAIHSAVHLRRLPTPIHSAVHLHHAHADNRDRTSTFPPRNPTTLLFLPSSTTDPSTPCTTLHPRRLATQNTWSSNPPAI